MLSRVKAWLGFGKLSDEQFEQQRKKLLTHVPVPVFWLFGKTGSGKSSIVKYLTGATTAEIGNGFRPQTKTSAQYDFPTAESPIARFLDSRGLGEVHYDPAEDIRSFAAKTQLVVVTARVADQALEPILAPLRKIREANRERPIVLALTCLHEAYPQQQHPEPDPFGSPSAPSEGAPPSPPLSKGGVGPATASQLNRALDATSGRTPPNPPLERGGEEKTAPLERMGRENTATSERGGDGWPEALPGDLRRMLVMQQARFAGLVDRIVPIDLTAPEEGFHNPTFGGQRLQAALIDVLPETYRQTIWQLDEVRENLQDLTERQALPLIVSYSSLATAAAAAPLPWVDIPVVMGLQTRMVYLLADLYGQKMQAELLLKMAGAVGGRLLMRFAVRAPLKFIPVLGQTANAAMAFAYTFSLGKACCWYFGEVRNGHIPTSAELDEVWGEQLKEAMQVWKRRTNSV